MLLSLVLAALAAALLRAWARPRTAARARLPLGPPRAPLIGNALQLGTEREWERYAEWAAQFGPLVYLEVLRAPVLVVHTHAAAVALLERRSAKYADRPALRMAGELMGWARGVTLVRAGARHRRYRRLLHGTLGPLALPRAAHGALEAQARALVGALRADPARVAHHVRTAIGRGIVGIAYGHGGCREDRLADGEAAAEAAAGDEYIALSEDAQEKFALAAAPFAFWVDSLPFLRHVPAWLPGAGFQRKARQWRDEIQFLVRKPIRVIRRRMLTHSAVPCYVTRELERDGLTAEDEEDIAWTAASLFTGGADTSTAALLSFILAMCLYPEARKKAQAELDSILRADDNSLRLPKVDDRPRLPYTVACVMEVLRWQPIAPLGVAHRLTEDDEYDGYTIPAGTTVITNIWAMTRDPERFADPEEFMPERYLGDMSLGTAEGFGFGRRICPGRWLAEISLFIAIASLLTVFDINSPVDENGIEQPPKVDYSSGVIRRPKPFSCRFIPRIDNSKLDSLLSSD